MRIAVTGARGLLGSAFVELAVREGHEVLGLDKQGGREVVSERLSFDVIDVTDAGQFARALAGCEALVHLAAHTSPSRAAAYKVHNDNVVASYNALVLAAEAGLKRVCQASSINAIGASFSREPRYDYFPLDEGHPTYNEDPYSLSKWICEAQASSVCRAYPGLGVASLRFHMLVPDRRSALERVKQWGPAGGGRKGLWGYTTLPGAARACLAALTADFSGHEVFYIVAELTASEEASQDLHRRFYPHVPLRRELVGHASFFDTAKALKLLSWRDC